MEKTAKKSRRLDPLVLILVFMVVASVAVIFLQSKGNLDNMARVQSSSRAENLAVEMKDKVSKLMSLPKDVPILAVVDSTEKLSERFLFRNAQEGDMVLIFPNENLVVVYRESEDKIINFGQINID